LISGECFGYLWRKSPLSRIGKLRGLSNLSANDALLDFLRKTLSASQQRKIDHHTILHGVLTLQMLLQTFNYWQQKWRIFSKNT
jgi:hypothetical protein